MLSHFLLVPNERRDYFVDYKLMMIEYFEGACMPVFAIMHTATNEYHYRRELQIANSCYFIRYTVYSVPAIHPNAQNSKQHKCKPSA